MNRRKKSEEPKFHKYGNGAKKTNEWKETKHLAYGKALSITAYFPLLTSFSILYSSWQTDLKI